MKKYLVILLALLVSQMVIANEKTNKNQSYEMSEEQLLKKPKLLTRAMISVLQSQNVDHIQTILPIYEKLKEKDFSLVYYGYALIAHSKKHYREAIYFYRKVMSSYPNLSGVRFYLASALLDDKQYDAALSQFKKIRAEKISNEMRKQVDYAIAIIKRNERINWGINSYLTFSKYKDEQTKKRLLSTGVHLDVWLAKLFNFQDNLYGKLSFYNANEFFHKNKQNNYNIVNLGFGFGWQNNKNDFSLNPYYVYTKIDKKTYSNTLGVSIKHNYQINNYWQSDTSLKIAGEFLKDRSFYNGFRNELAQSFTFGLNAQTSFKFGGAIYHFTARDDYDNYIKPSLLFTWNQEWKNGLVTALELNPAIRFYLAKDPIKIGLSHMTDGKKLNAKIITGQFSGSLSLWHRSFHFLGITPKLVLNYGKDITNDPFVDTDGDFNAQIELSKYF